MRRSTLIITCFVAMLCLGLTVPVAMALDGRLATATVSFGAWHTDPPLDRFPNESPREGNHHQIIPPHVTIPVGGTITFIISGLHQVIVYDNGTQPEDIDVEKTTPTTGTPAGVLLIDDPTNRIYRGPDPSLYPRDRVEVVTFPKVGVYLVICGVQDHFVVDEMFAFVTVLPKGHDKD
jgi:plastocyanin